MAAATHLPTGLAYEIEGDGIPVVFLHGATFDRRTWRPIVERLGGSVMSITIDLPAHGESGGSPARLEDVAAQVHDLLEWLGVERQILVGHSMGGGLALVYAGAYPARAVVSVDSGPDVLPFAQLVQQIEPALGGPGFEQAWRPFEGSLGLDRIPEPQRSLVLDSHRVRQEVVLGYWQELLSSDPAELQASIDAQIADFEIPCLFVFGRPVTERERQRLDQLEATVEEWIGDGPCVHLVEPDRFAARLREFVDYSSPR